MFKKHRKLTNRGDTIVEVLIVLAVLSLAFAISYSTATRALSKSRNAQEHSEATNITNTQLELLRTAFAKQTPVPGDQPFCLRNDGTVVGFGSVVVIPDDPSLDTLTGGSYPADCIKDTFYHVSIKARGNNLANPDDPTRYYDIRLRWDGVNSLGRQQVQTTYKSYIITQDPNLGTQLQASPVSVTVQIKKIPPRSVTGDVDKTPSCTSAATADKTGTSFTLLGPAGYSTTGVTGAGSSRTFTSIPELFTGQYTARVTGLPAGYELCNGTSATNVSTPYNSNPVPATGTQVINNLKIRPRCTRYSYTTSTTTYSWTMGARQAAYDNWFVALNNPSYPNGNTQFVAGPGMSGRPETAGKYYWYVFSGTVAWWDPTYTGYYWIYDAAWTPTTTTTTNYNYSCPS